MIIAQLLEYANHKPVCYECGHRSAVIVTVGTLVFGLCSGHFNQLRGELKSAWEDFGGDCHIRCPGGHKPKVKPSRDAG